MYHVRSQRSMIWIGTTLVSSLAILLSTNGGCGQWQAGAPTTGQGYSRPGGAAVTQEYGGMLAGNTPRASSSAVAGDSTRPVTASPVSYEETSLFGDLPGLQAVRYQSRSALSLEQHTFATEGRDFDPTISPDGELLAFASTRHSLNSQIYVKHTRGSTVTQLTADQSHNLHPAFSPDGTRIAFTSNRSGNYDIYITSLDGKQLMRVTETDDHEIHPSWSPDGEYLVYARMTRSGQRELWVTSTTAPTSRKFIAYGTLPVWSPTDNVIAFQRARERGGYLFSVWTIRWDGNEPSLPMEVADAAGMAVVAPSWSPDGRFLTYTTLPRPRGTGNMSAANIEDAQIWMVANDGTSRMRVTSKDIAGYHPAWGADGRIYFCSSRTGVENIWSILPVLPATPDAVSDNPVRLGENTDNTQIVDQ